MRLILIPDTIATNVIVYTVLYSIRGLHLQNTKISPICYATVYTVHKSVLHLKQFEKSDI